MTTDGNEVSDGKALSLYIKPEVERRVKNYLSQGSVTSAVARKVAEIVRRFSRYGECHRYSVARLSRRGEFRIRKCIKYDLGHGYRLVGLRRSDSLILVFVGPHEECGRWIEKRRRLDYGTDDLSGLTRCESSHHGKECEHVQVQDDFPDAYERHLVSRLDDGILRKIFFGLCQSPGS